MGCRMKEASIAAADLKDYKRAVDIYEAAGKADAGDSARRFNVKEHLFRAGLCRLCMSVV